MLTDKTIVKVALTTGVALLVLAAAGFIAVQLAGEHVDADGVLHEPFLLKVATACALVVGAVLTGVSLLVRRR